METDRPDPNAAATVANSPGAALPGQGPPWRRYRAMIAYAAVLALIFCRPLFELVVFAPHKELYSHILLIPFISGYLIWLKRGELGMELRPNWPMAVLPMLAGAAVLVCYRIAVGKGWSPAKADYLAVMIFSFLLFLLAGAFIFLGSDFLRKIAFPAAFLLFCIPFPDATRLWIETLLQNGSATAAYVFFRMSGMPVLQSGTRFQLPSFSLEVAPECSGIHSSLVLVITSLLAAYLFLKSPWKRSLLVLVVIPLALLRNGFRVFVIGQLCVRVGPQMIDSWIHHHGGPVFFVLSLAPLFLLLVYLSKSELRNEPALNARPKE